MADIFLSYASEDRARAETIAHALEVRGWSVWWDPVILPGETWAEVIERELKAARCVVVLWSATSVASDWVKNEARHGHRRRVLVPALIEPVEPPFEFEHVQAARLALWSSDPADPHWLMLLAAIEAKIGRVVVAPAEPQPDPVLEPEPEPPGTDDWPVAKRTAKEARRKAEMFEAPPPSARRASARRRVWPWAGGAAALAATIIAVVIGVGPERVGEDVGQEGATDRTTTTDAVVEPKAEEQPEADTEQNADRLKPGDTFQDCDVCPKMVVVPAGLFVMGSPPDEKGRLDWEGPQRTVTFAEPFAIGATEVTFAEWDACVADGGCDGHRPNDEGWGRGGQPVIDVSWHHAAAYCTWLSQTTGKPYRLPSEAEWEYAARAGTTTPFSFGRTITTDQANFNGNFPYVDGPKGEFRERTVPVGSLPANPWGLHEVHGNVWEWVEDHWHDSYRGAPTDGSAWVDEGVKAGADRVIRGGSWFDHARFVRSAFRSWFEPDRRDHSLGFRCSRVQDGA